MTVTYNAADPDLPDLNVFHSINDEAAFRTAQPVALGFRVHSDLSGIDASWKRHEAVAASMGIVRLGYDYEDDGTPDVFLGLFAPAPGRIPVLDAEYKGLSMAEAESWIVTVAKAWGRMPVLYGHSLLNSWNPSPSSPLRKCPTWQATYGMSLTPVPWALPPFLWQYSDGSTKWPSPGPRVFPGCGPCDMNTLQISVPTLRLMAGIKPPPPGGDMTLDEIAQGFGYSDANSMKARLDYAKGFEDGAEGKAEPPGSPPAYVAGYKRATALLAGEGGGTGPHTHSLPGFPTGTGGVA